MIDKPRQAEAWQDYDLDGMLEAFDRVIEAHYTNRHPFHDPVNRDARMAFRMLRSVIASIKSNTVPQNTIPPGYKLVPEEQASVISETNNREVTMSW